MCKPLAALWCGSCQERLWWSTIAVQLQLLSEVRISVYSDQAGTHATHLFGLLLAPQELPRNLIAVIVTSQQSVPYLALLARVTHLSCASTLAHSFKQTLCFTW